MKKNILVGVLLFWVTAFGFGVMEENSTRRFGIFIGANNGGRERTRLRYAVSDARAVSRVFAEMGGIAGGDSVLLVEPGVGEINSRIDTLHEQVIRARSSHARTEIVFYYSGHSDEEGLLLNRERYYYRELRDRINRIPSDIRIVILDSCASGAFTRIKGGVKTLPFLADSSVSAEGYAFLTSSSADEVSQESDRIAASYFTHALVTGLRGAADMVGDGRVTLNELYRFAYSETLARTETSMFGAQHPSYDIQMIGTGDLVLTDIRETSAGMVFDENITGRLAVRDASENLIAEINKTSVRPLELGLEPGLYRITLQQGNTLLRAEVNLARDRRTLVAAKDFFLIAANPTRRRGGEETDLSEEDASLGAGSPKSVYTVFFNNIHEPFKLPQIGFINMAWGNFSTLQAGFMNWNSQNFRGLQAGFVNITRGNFDGVQAGFVNTAASDRNGLQAGYINTTAGNTAGLQAGFVNTTAGDVKGFQAGYINTIAGEIKGFQAGFVNTAAGETKGLQTGFVNTAVKQMAGAQIGFVNVAAQGIKGLQIGFVNYADNIEYGIPIGFISIVKNGGYRAFEYSFSEYHTYTAAFKLGVEKFYTNFIVGYNQTKQASWENFVAGVGIGSIFSVGKIFFINTELNNLTGWGNRHERYDGRWRNIHPVNFLGFSPSFGVNIGKRFSITAGPSVTWVNNFNWNRSQNIPLPKPLFAIYSYDINENNRIVLGAKAALRVRL